jgi:hypothetical protein
MRLFRRSFGKQRLCQQAGRSSGSLGWPRPSLLGSGRPERARTLKRHSGEKWNGEPVYRNAGGHQWIRGSDETLDAFADRARAGARESKEPLLLIGGLPKTPEQQDVAMAAFQAWLLVDDGVPPCETGPQPSSRLSRMADR